MKGDGNPDPGGAADGASADRLALRLVLLVGLAAVASFHSGGAVDARDALAAGALRDGTVASRGLALGVDLIRLLDVRIGLFRAAHLTAGILLAVAAALSAGVAARLAGSARAGLAAALLAGSALLFGADTGRFGMEAGPVAPMLAALAAAAWLWTGARPRPFAGGLLLGAGIAAHPAALFAVPGFLLLARDLQPGTRRRAGLGLALGLALLHLPPPGGSFGDAIGAWWHAGSGGAFWGPAGPARWPHGAAQLGAALLAGAGPLTVAAGIAGVAVVARGGGGGGARAFLVAFALAAAAAIARAHRDPGLTAVVVWSFALLAAPALAAGERRLARVASLLPGAAIVAAAALALANLDEIDHSAETGTEWAMDSLAPLPDGALLLTRNPVHAALSADGARPEVEVMVLAPATPPGEARAILQSAVEARPVFLDASLFFDAPWRIATLGEQLRVLPHGLTFRVRPRTARVRDAETVDWSALHLEIDEPASPLRDGMGTRKFYARSLLQSAFLLVDGSFPTDAEHEFVFALSYEPCNKTLAALGLARIFLARRQPESAIRTLEDYVREEDDGAWNALQVLGAAYGRVDRDEDALRALRRALPLVPAELAGERTKIERSIATIEQRRATSGS